MTALMSIQPSSGREQAGPGFDAPAEMLLACHDRVRRFCGILERLPPYLEQHGADTQARQAATNVLRYFETAAPHHHADEEQDVFPALREAAHAHGDHTLPDTLRDLEAEHIALDQQWQVLRAILHALADGTTASLPAGLVHTFCQHYQKHAAREETEVFPAIDRWLDPTIQQTLGQRMAARRQPPGAVPE